ncbi:unnamed protein product [Durusdinium trenchii]|uniref:Uncharacterized protein n=2 Tax=Durusdinium trenchii TaxID=1381693 RepID=A0ABP0R7G3_9DINO
MAVIFDGKASDRSLPKSRWILSAPGSWKQTARRLFIAAGHLNANLQQQTVKVCGLEKFLANLRMDISLVERQIEILQCDRRALLLALQEGEEHFLLEEELTLSRIVSRRLRQLDTLRDRILEQQRNAQHAGLSVLSARQREMAALHRKQVAKAEADRHEDEYHEELLESSCALQLAYLDFVHSEAARCRKFITGMMMWSIATLVVVDMAFRMMDFPQLS